MKEMVEFEEQMLKYSWQKLSDNDLHKAKEWGFSDKYLAKIFQVKETEVRTRRKKWLAMPALSLCRSAGKGCRLLLFQYTAGKDLVPVSPERRYLSLAAALTASARGLNLITPACTRHSLFGTRAWNRS